MSCKVIGRTVTLCDHDTVATWKNQSECQSLTYMYSIKTSHISVVLCDVL